MAFIKANGINIYYEQQGEGPDLVIINGLSGDHLSWELMLPILAKHFRVLTFDNRGAGQTDVPDEPYSIKQMADDTAALMQALSINEAHITGHSMGGQIAQQLAIHHADKVQKLMIVCSFVQPYARATRWIELTHKQMLAGVDPALILEAAVIYCFSPHFVAQCKNIDDYIARSLNNPYPQSPIGFARQYQACVAYNGLESLSRISKETLVIAGEDDILTPVFCSEAITARIANAQLKVLAGAHMPNLEQPENLSHILLEFVGV